MNQTFKFLVITDHRVHKSSNPIYPLVKTLLTHNQCYSVEIASRGNSQNDDFFAAKREDFYTIKAEQDFQFQESGKQFSKKTIHRTLEDYDAILMRLARPVSMSIF